MGRIDIFEYACPDVVACNEHGNEPFSGGVDHHQRVQLPYHLLETALGSEDSPRLAWKFDIRRAADIPFPDTSAIQNPTKLSAVG